MKNLINEVTRIKEMMGVKLLTESPLLKILEKGLLGSTEALVKSGEKTFSKEIEQAYDKALADVIADATSPYAKKLESAGVKTLEDLANLEGKGFAKEEVQAFTQDLLKRAAKVVEQFAPEAAQDLIDKTVKEQPFFVNGMKNVDKAMSAFMDGVPAEKVESVKTVMGKLEKVKQDIINNKALSQTEKDIAVKRFDDAIASLESKLTKGVDNATAAALKVSEEQAKRLADELAKSFGNVEELFTVPLEKVKSMAEAAGWPKEEVNKFIKLFSKNAPKNEAEFLQKATDYIKLNQGRIAEQLRKEGLEEEAKRLTKMTGADILKKITGFHSKVWKSGYLGKIALIVLWSEMIIQPMGGVTAIWDKVKPFLSRTWSGDGATPETDVKPDETKTPTTSAVASKTTFDTYMSGASKIFSENKSQYTWDVDPSDKTIIIVHTPAAGDVKYKVNSDGTTYNKQ